MVSIAGSGVDGINDGVVVLLGISLCVRLWLLLDLLSSKPLGLASALCDLAIN